MAVKVKVGAEWVEHDRGDEIEVSNDVLYVHGPDDRGIRINLAIYAKDSWQHAEVVTDGKS